MPPGPLLTPRLRLDPWGEEHAELLCRLAAMPAVTRYIGDGSPWSPARAREGHDRTAAHWHEHGFGWRAIVGRAGGEPLGLVALNFAGSGSGVAADEFEIGWWLHPDAWGRGLAREAGAAVRDHGFAELAAPSQVARIQPANAASLAVARALGLGWESDCTGRLQEPIAILRLTAEAGGLSPANSGPRERDWPRRARRGRLA